MESQQLNSLKALSRSIVNRNVNREDLDSLPLPIQLRDECFANSAADRSDKPISQRKSIEFCRKNCCFFSFKRCMCEQIPDYWSESYILECDLHNFYQQYPNGFSSSSEWLQLPDRNYLIEQYKNEYKNEYKNAINEEMLEACLNTCRFDESTGLGSVHEWIRRYLYYQHTHGWYYVNVSVSFFKNFLNYLKRYTVALLPYGCINDNGGDSYELNNLILHQRRMIIVVKDNTPEMECRSESHWGWVYKIEDVGRLINTIALVSRPKSFEIPKKHYVIFNPMILHASWWMYLLVPSKYLEYFTAQRIIYNDKIAHDFYGKNKRDRVVELDFENCVVKFEPLYQCVGEQIKNVSKYIIENDSSFVYWLGGKKLKVAKLQNLPKRIQCSKRKFLEWCVEREMNTLLNLNGSSWVDFLNKTKLLSTREGYDWFLGFNEME